MCGILGVITNTNKIEEFESQILPAIKSLKHRGPDSDGLVRESKMIFGHTRLSIVGLDHGTQPMKSADGRYVITFNGEVYNYQALAQDLRKKGHSLTKDSDTEVILAAYQTYGKSCVQHFQGMFAFVIYDIQTQEVFAARDRFGIKPFYYAQKNQDSFLFASEMRAVHILGNFSFTPDHSLFDEFLVWGYVAGGKTLHQNIFELPAGHFLTLKNGQIKMERYWYPVAGSELDISENDAVDLIDEALKKAVALWAPESSKTPVYSLLSGGLDSSLVTKLLSYQCEDLTAITAYFPHDPELDERHLTAQLLKTIKAKSSNLPIQDGYIIENFDRLVRGMDKPIHDSNTFTLMAICEKIKELMPEVKIVFCGEGSDETFGGYARHRSIAKEYDETRDSNLLYYALNRVALPRLNLFTKQIQDQNPSRIDIVKKLQSKDSINRCLELDQLTFLTAYLHRQDIVGMMFGLEFRAPFLEHALTDVVNLLPGKYKVSDVWQKYILRKVADRHIPNEIIWNKQKYQFAAPVSRMLTRGPLRDRFERVFNSKQSYLSSVYSTDGILSLLEKHDPQTSGQDHGNTLFRLLTLESWIKSW